VAICAKNRIIYKGMSVMMLLRWLSLMLLTMIIAGTIYAVDASASSGGVCATPRNSIYPNLVIICFKDTNNNGIQDVGEPGIRGEEIRIDGDWAHISETTECDGSIRRRLHPGIYRIEHILRPGWNSSTNTTKYINLVSGLENGAPIYFGGVPYGLNLITNANSTETQNRTLSNRTWNCSSIEPPEIILTPPDGISFTGSVWECVTFSLTNPPNYHVKEAYFKIKLPPGWEFNPDVKPLPFIEYIADKKAFLITDFGYYKMNSTGDWFDIRPGPNVAPGNYSLIVESALEYNYRDPEYPEHDLLCCNNIPYSLNLTLVGSRGGLYNTIRDNSWIFALIGAICSIVLVLFGPGGEDRVKNVLLYINNIICYFKRLMAKLKFP
jgi:hypothetical protein